MSPITAQILTTLSLYNRMLPSMLSDVVASHKGCEDQQAVNLAIVHLIDQGRIAVDGAYLCYVPDEEDDQLESYLSVADEFRARDMERYHAARRKWRRYAKWRALRSWLLHPIANIKRKWGKRK